MRRRLIMPLQTTANLIEAVRFGDYSMRGRRARRGDALGEVLLEINQLGEALGRERMASLEASALVQGILAELDTAVFAFDTNNLLKLANRAASELMARSIESMLGQSSASLELAEFTSGDGETTVTTAVRRFAGRSGRFEIHRRHFRESGIPYDLLVITDLSRALRDEERQAWQRLIRVLGHEINNSLTPIKSLAQSLRGMMGNDSNARRDDVEASLGVIADRADALGRFVATYSQLARLPVPVKKPVKLRALLAGTLRAQEFQSVHMQPGLDVTVHADAGQIGQVFINVLRNAREAVAEVGDGNIEIKLRLERNTAQIVIRDEGPGVANPANLFVPFFTTKPGGSGVGLTLSRQIMEAHGGSLLLENRTDGRGCVAVVELPVLPP